MAQYQTEIFFRWWCNSSLTHTHIYIERDRYITMPQWLKCDFYFSGIPIAGKLLFISRQGPGCFTGFGYRNWPWYGLRWSGWYCNPAQHELCRPSHGRAGRHNECCAGLQYQPRQRRPYKWSISILPLSQFLKKEGKLASSASCTAVRPHRRLRNDAWRRDS